MRIAVGFLCLGLLSGAALAQSAPGHDVTVTLGGGGRLQPDYEGSNDYIFSPMAILGLKFQINPLTGQPSSETGFSLRPAFRYVAKRSGSDNADLKGMNPIDAAFELGFNAGWTERNWAAFLEARQGIGGHGGQVFDLGIDAILRPVDRLTVNLGPRLSFATGDYMSTYFDVTTLESKKTGFAPYSAAPGLRSYGVALRADYDLTPQWLLRFESSYSRLASEAADSPVVKAVGSADQFTVGIGAAYRFGFDYR